MFKRYGFLLLALCATVVLALPTAPAAAAETGPQWTVTAFSLPTNLAPGGKGVYRVYVENTGGAPSDGETVTVTDVLPEHVRAAAPVSGKDYVTGEAMVCTGLVCTYSNVPGVHTGVVGVDNILELEIPVEVEGGVREGETVTNRVTVSGGGAAEAIRETPSVISSTPAAFGIAPGSTATVLSSAQAGGHPDLTTALAFNSVSSKVSAGDARDSGEILPPGFAGDLADTPKCPLAGFSEEEDGALHCSLSSVVGTVTVYLGDEAAPFVRPLMNLSTNPGEIAKLGFSLIQYGIEATVSLTPGEYGVRTTFTKIGDEPLTRGISLTVWGVPSDHTHDLMRGLRCGFAGFGCGYVNETVGEIHAPKMSELPEGQGVTTPPIPYLTSPTQCSGEPLQATLFANSWEEPEHEVDVSSPVGPLTGCGLLEFAPAITVSPDTTRADTPAGLTFGVNMGQEGLTNVGVNSEADIKDTTVTLPAGVAINPGQANGLGACPVGPASHEPGHEHYGDNLPLAGENGEEARFEGPPYCPSDSKVGHVAVQTPILRNKLEGEVYVLQSEPPNLKLLVAPEDPQDGIYVKFVGDVHLNETTGQLVTTFEDTPQLPFTNLKLSFSGGAQAALTTPTRCGVYAASTDFTPWSTPFVADAFPSGSFAIEAGTGGTACPSSPLPFDPSLVAGPTTDQAGGFTDFSLLLQRSDGQQRIDGLQFKAPEGLTGLLAKVPLCTNAQAEANACPEASKIGHTVVESGPGPYPLVVPEPGQPPAPIYLTEKYGGAPFGLSIVVPLHVGPFVLPTQRVRARIEVNPITSALVVTTNALPQEVAGVPTDLREVDAVIERPEFMVNPTNCEAQEFSGTAYGAPPPGVSEPAQSAAISSRTQVGSCRSLEFHPQLGVSASSKSSRANGTSVSFKLSYPKGALGKDSWLKELKVDLPKQLPARLSTLQKACPAATFNANPADCGVASRIGAVRARTELLPVPLEGPVFFVSNGGAKFPEAVFVLQGDGVTVEIHAETFINEKTGVTSATFHAFPDDPFEEGVVTLPAGRYSEFTATSNLCKGTLKMPTAIVGQNGAEIHQNTTVKVNGCTKAKQASKHRKTKTKKKG